MEKEANIICRIQEELRESGDLDHKTLERDRGFLIYLSRTYRMMASYLKGAHQTMDTLRPGRTKDECMMFHKEMLACSRKVGYEIASLDENTPARVKPVDRLAFDLFVLPNLLEGPTPRQVLVRMTSTAWVGYGMGDTSKKGYGATVHLGLKLYFRYRQWSSIAEKESSNYRELCNLVETIESLYSEGKLRYCKIFLLTDNIVTDYAYYKGSSSCKALFDLVLRLRLVQQKGGLMLHVVNVAGTRMIQSGVDGLSRDETGEGVMQGKEMLSFIPLHLDSLERSNGIVYTWIEFWWLPELKLVQLTLDGWYNHVFDEGFSLWVPLPVVADAAVDQLCRNYQLHERNLHTVIVPRLFTHVGGSS